MAVFVLDKHHHPLMPCSEKRARLLLQRGRAVVVRLVPFAIRLKDRIGGVIQPIRIKLDPGSKTTGMALVREQENLDTQTGEITRTASVLWLAELTHRGYQISEALTARSAMRARRRSANLRHRQPRFNNRTKPKGWLAPSLRHRIKTTLSWVERLRRFAPITTISQELVRFDIQAMQTNLTVRAWVFRNPTHLMRLVSVRSRRCAAGSVRPWQSKPLDAAVISAPAWIASAFRVAF